ncbi:hypothetical protein pipiens_017931 [Culex pipiens pipiens]|uniref:Uncharacterized protein n=1 Tax=Culex pipiens pipiens TaxID=38569 RepID=A0ABD1CEB8_CULPP
MQTSPRGSYSCTWKDYVEIFCPTTRTGMPGTYDFVITKGYRRNNTPPKVLAKVFVIDVSYNKVKSGLVHLLCAEFKNNIRHLPVDELADFFRSCDLDTTNLFFAKQGLFKLQDNKP